MTRAELLARVPEPDRPFVLACLAEREELARRLTGDPTMDEFMDTMWRLEDIEMTFRRYAGA
jgi:hypothetical protein